MSGKALHASIALVLLIAASIAVDAARMPAMQDSAGEKLRKTPPYAAMLDVSSNRHTRSETYARVQNRLTLEGYVKIMEDNRLEVWHLEKNASIRVVDKTTGYIWGGLSSEKPEDMNVTWSGIGNAVLSIDFFDKRGLEKRLSIADKKVDKKYIVNGKILKYNVNYTELGISFSFEMELRGGALYFRMIDGSIKEEGEFSLGAVYFVPFFGSTRADEIDGYMFVPDGPGALIRFNKPSQHLVNFDKRVYGKDYGIDNLFEVNDLKSSRPNDFATEEPQVMMPVFGMVHGVKQNAFLATIEKGAEYASIVATPSGIVTNYNWVAAKFIYKQKYLQPTSKSGAGVQIVQKERNRFDAEICYNFLSGDEADYVGMAKYYRNLLKQKNMLKPAERIDNSIPLQLDLIGADIQKGFVLNRVLPVTMPDKAKSIAEDLFQNGVENITMVFKGWQKGGLNGSKPSRFDFENKLGGMRALTGLAKYIDLKGGRFYFYENPVTVNETQIDFRKEGGNSLSQSLIKIERDNDNIWFKDTYFIESGLVAGYVAEKAGLYSQKQMNGMALDEFGSKLYAENQRDHVTTRQEARILLEGAANKVKTSIDMLAFYKPNQYLWKYADEILSIPMVNSQYLFETDTVPFMQIVLKGSVDYYAPYSNMSFYSKTDVLKIIEYGAYPSFLLTGLSNHELRHTPIEELYSTKYEDWSQYIKKIYHEINFALSKVEGRKIEDRRVLKPGVVEVKYEGGSSIVVNYTGESYIYEGVNVPAQDYVVKEGGRYLWPD